MKIALYLHELDRIPATVSITWPDFVDFIVNYVEESPCTVADCAGRECHWKSHSKHPGNPMAWSPVEIAGSRLALNVASVNLLVLDLDHLREIPAIPFEHVRHTTHNHRDEDKCVRAVLRLSRPVAAADWRAFLAAAVRFLDVPADPTCKDLARIFYRPSFAQGAPHEAVHVPGPVLDVDAVLAWASANPLPEPPPAPPRLFHDEDAWDLDGDAVLLAVSTIAACMTPEVKKHPLALALAGMLRAHGATMEDARHILRESFAEGGSENPDARAKTVEHTWALPEEAAMTGFTRVCQILGEEAAKEIGDCFADARNEVVRRLLRGGVVGGEGAPSSAAPSPFLAPAPSSTLESVRKRLARLKARKLKSPKRDDQIRGVVLGALLEGDDLQPYLPDGSPVEVAGKAVDRDAAIRMAMGMAAYRLPAGTPFDFVRALARMSLVRMRRAGESVDDLERIAERAFLEATGKKVKARKQRAAEEAADLERWRAKTSLVA